ncbi:DUF4192 family protein [Agromyces sp. Marseille-Q5079]|uniref:DUF4192 family protein n=1 Tax=Agromyces sp. Marseille-Q5079 TaxID=3439059 RepID=UPI003D9C8E91
MTAIIRAASAHDFLALVPELAGFHPRDSLVCVAFTGNRTAGVLRHDLPAESGAHEALVAAVVGTICRLPDVDALVPIVYTDETFLEHGGLPQRSLLDLLVDRAEQAGFVVRDVLCQARDGWASALDPEAPIGGRPLGLISASAAARGVPVSERSSGSDQAGALPEPDPQTAIAIAAALEQFAGSATAEAAIAALGRFADPVELVESLLGRRRRSSASAPSRLAWFLDLAARPPIRDAMMLQIAFGSVVAELALDVADVTMPDEAGDVGPVVDAEPVFAGRARAEVDDLLARLLLGQTMLRPDRRRVERALELLRGLIANAPTEARPGACCIAAWLAWSLGRGSVAGALLEHALAIDVEHSMARLLDDFIGTGALPEWAFASGGW